MVQRFKFGPLVGRCHFQQVDIGCAASSLSKSAVLAYRVFGLTSQIKKISPTRYWVVDASIAAASASVSAMRTVWYAVLAKPADFTIFSILAIIAGFFHVVGVLKLNSTWRFRQRGMEASKNFSISRCKHFK